MTRAGCFHAATSVAFVAFGLHSENHSSSLKNIQIWGIGCEFNASTRILPILYPQPGRLNHNLVWVMAVILREAKPIPQEGLVFAGFLDQAAEGFFGFYLGSQRDEIVSHAYLQPDNDFSYENVLFAEQDGVIVGGACGFTGWKRKDFVEEPLVSDDLGVRIKMAVIRFLLSPMFRIMESMEEDDYYLLALAVNDSCRGQGVGSALLDAMEMRALKAGAKRFALDVSVNNGSARRLYERRGMEINSEWPKASFLPTILIRMAKELSPCP